MIVMGIDPGKKGAIATLDKLGNVSYNSMPEIFEDLLTLLMSIKDRNEVSMVFVEDTQYRPNQKGVITTLVNYGRLIGYLEALNFRYTRVSAMKWKKKLNLSKDKIDSINLVNNKYNLGLRKTQDGIAEAILIAEYGLSS
jgi:hypothetical protein